MNIETVFIDLDFLPPTSERLCAIPEACVEKGFTTLCFKLVDNFPWDFDNRMKSSTSFDESAIGFLSNRSKQLNLKLAFRFPDVDEFSRLLRLNGYRKIIDKKMKYLSIDPSAVGFKPLIEAVADDMYALCPDINELYLFRNADNKDYIDRVISILDENSYKYSVKTADPDWDSTLAFLYGDSSTVLSAFTQLKDHYEKFIVKVADLKHLIVMSSLSTNQPAAGGQTINCMFNELHLLQIRFDSAAEVFLNEGSGFLSAEWLEKALEAYNLVLVEELTQIEIKLRQALFLN